MTTPVPLPVAPLADVAIVGAGLCGLALARVLTARGLRVQVLEARSRLGGRVLTAQCEATGQALDLGPTWFWPETEPRIAALLERAQDADILTVGAADSFLALGGMVNFMRQEDKLRIEIGLDAVQRARLVMSAKLLAVAKVVTGRLAVPKG